MPEWAGWLIILGFAGIYAGFYLIGRAWGRRAGKS